MNTKSYLWILVVMKILRAAERNSSEIRINEEYDAIIKSEIPMKEYRIQIDNEDDFNQQNTNLKETDQRDLKEEASLEKTSKLYKVVCFIFFLFSLIFLICSVTLNNAFIFLFFISFIAWISLLYVIINEYRC